MATVGSIGQPGRCREEADKWDAYAKVGLWRWNYETGKQESCTPRASSDTHKEY